MGLFNDLFRRPASQTPESPTQTLENPPVLRAANLQGIGAREGQEDSFAILGASNPAESGLFALVADGMGGMLDGKAASEWAAECLLQLYQERRPGQPMPEWYYQTVHAVSDSVYQRFGGRSGTTLVSVHIQENSLLWLSAGDSGIFSAGMAACSS